MDLIVCKKCESVVSESYLNRDEKVANCQRCGTLFYFGNREITKSDISRKPIVKELPQNIVQESDGMDLIFTIQHSGFTKVFMTFFALFWNTIVGIFVITSLASGEYFILLFISLHLIVGICVGYYALMLWLNKPQLIVDKDYILMNQGVLKNPFKRDFFVDRTHVKQLYCERYRSGSVNNRPVFAFRVMVRKFDGESVKLISNLPKYHQALYMEQQIEKFMKIQDERVEEEYQV